MSVKYIYANFTLLSKRIDGVFTKLLKAGKQSNLHCVHKENGDERLIESMMGLRPRQGNLRLVFRLFSLMRGLPSIRLK